jgi:hypothetical protein
MSRHYTVCEMTPSSTTPTRHSSRSFVRVYPRARHGFLFHDTDAPLDIADIRHALLRLSSLHQIGEGDSETTANQALVLRINDHTLACSFSISAFPQPASLRGPYDRSINNTPKYEFLGRANLSGWLLTEVNNPACKPVPFKPNDYYDNCERLERLTENCPCALLKDRECINTLVRPSLPEPLSTTEVFDRDFPLSYTMLRKVAYRKLPGDWALASPKTTGWDDFAETFRPWDYHNFANVDTRKAEISDRAKKRYTREKKRASQCAACVFSKKYPNLVEDCGQLNSCTEPVTEEMALTVIDDWLDESGFLTMKGFTAAQRDILISLSGETVMAKMFGSARRISCMYAGFYVTDNANGWKFRMVTEGANLQRAQDFSSYAELQEVLLTLPDVDITPVTFTRKVYYILAAYGRCRMIYESGKSGYRRRLTRPIKLLDGTYRIETDGAAARYVSIKNHTLETASVKQLIHINPDIAYTNVPSLYARLMERTFNKPKVSLPVIP